MNARTLKTSTSNRISDQKYGYECKDDGFTLHALQEPEIASLMFGDIEPHMQPVQRAT